MQRKIDPRRRCRRDKDLQIFGPERRRIAAELSLRKLFVDELYSRLVPILALAYEHDLDPEIVLCSKVVPGNPPDERSSPEQTPLLSWSGSTKLG
jgi:hypothetical protein